MKTQSVQLCVPVTDIFRRNHEKLLPLVEAVSFKNPTDEVFDGKEHMLECSLNIANPNFEEQMDQEGLLKALRSGRFTSFACDLGPQWTTTERGESPNGYPRYLPGTGLMTQDEYLRQSELNVAFLRSNFSGRIKAENLNYFPTGGYELVCGPQFIARTLRHLNVELLLDIGHLTVSAHNLGCSMSEFLDLLPLELVSEVQISGSNVVEGIWEDTHEVPSERDMMVLDDIFNRANVQYLTLEYYKNDEKLVSAYRWLHSAVVGAEVPPKAAAD